MKPRSRSSAPAALLILALLVAIGSCTVKLVSFEVPAVVTAGGIFEVVVTGTDTAIRGDHGAVAAVLQIPNGVTVLSSANENHGFSPMTVNDAKVLALYKAAERGHYLVAWSTPWSRIPHGGLPPRTLRVRLRAPSAGKLLTFKVSLASQSGSAPWQIDDPKGQPDFARITGAPHAKWATLAPGPWTGAPIYQNDSLGLPHGVNLQRGPWTRLATGDVNGDGDDDLVGLVSSGTASGPEAFLHSRPGSPWTRVGPTAQAIKPAMGVAVGDLNGDGHADLAAEGHVWFGDGGTSWKAVQVDALFGQWVAVADVNNDSLDDVAFTSLQNDWRIRVFLSDGKGGFREASQGLTRQSSYGMAQGEVLLPDLNGDGRADLVWVALTPKVWLGDGKGVWTPVSSPGFSTDWHTEVAAADLDGDGYRDLVFCLDTGLSLPSTLAIYQNTGRARFGRRTGTGIPAVARSSQYTDVALADFDRDGRVDILVGRLGSLEIWRNLGGFRFARATLPDLPTANFGRVDSVAVGDFNGDTFPDVAAASVEYGPTVWLNQRTGFSRFGNGCGGKLPSIPAMGHAGGTPRLGNKAFAWTLDRASPSKSAVLAIGLSKRHLFGAPVLPLDLGPIGAPGCSLLVEHRMLFSAVTDARGQARYATPIPAVPALLGQVFFGQWAVLDPGANALGLTVSNAAAAKIGR